MPNNPTDIIQKAVASLAKEDVPLPEVADFMRGIISEAGGGQALAKKAWAIFEAADTTPATKQRFMEQFLRYLEISKASEDQSEKLGHLTKAELLAKVKGDFPFMEEMNHAFLQWVAAGKPVPSAAVGKVPDQGQTQSPSDPAAPTAG